MSRPFHAPVLLAEVVEFLDPRRGGVFLDCTVGLGGHAEAILEAAPSAELVGIDRDPEALAWAAVRLERFGSRVDLRRGDFRDLSRLVADRAPFAGVLADFGVSSLQLDSPERGFSFRWEGPLDMRMGPGPRTAHHLVHELSQAELETILREFGEEPEARRVARSIVEARGREKLETTADLARVVRRAKRARSRGIDPVTRTFQALRIAVNEELDAIDRLLGQVVDLLAPEGKLVVLSYHSLEDRRVKERFRELSRGERNAVTHQIEPGSKILELLTRRAVRPSEQEVTRNPRSRSVRLRAARRI